MIARPGGVYAAWTEWLARFGRGEVDGHEGLEPMDGKTLGAPAAARLARHVEVAMDARLRLWSDAFSRDLERVSRPDDLRRANIAARRRFAPIRALASTPPLLPELAHQLQPALGDILERAQTALEEQARRLGGDQQVLAAIRDTPLTGTPAAMEPLSPEPEVRPPSGARRSIILPGKGGNA